MRNQSFANYCKAQGGEGGGGGGRTYRPCSWLRARGQAANWLPIVKTVRPKTHLSMKSFSAHCFPRNRLIQAATCDSTWIIHPVYGMPGMTWGYFFQARGVDKYERAALDNGYLCNASCIMQIYIKYTQTWGLRSKERNLSGPVF